MDWIQPTFVEPSTQPRKKQRLDKNNPKSGSYSQHILSNTISHSKGVSWIDKYTPTSKNELIIHKKKVEEVESWLLSLDDGVCKVLLLTGPPGCGKLTTLKVLCKSLKIQLSEWITPPSQEYDPDNFTGTYCSQQRAFEEFLLRATRYASVFSSPSTKRTAVVKDIPNVFIKDPKLFNEFLAKFNSCDGVSVVFIMNENSLILELFPESVKFNLKIKTINFNSITKKSVCNVLTNILRKEKCSLENKVIVDISETCEGDLRNAIMSLNFISTKGNVSQTKKVKSFSKSDSKENTTKLLITDPSIDLFHGLGRVLYVKRNSDGLLLHDPNSIVDSFVTSTNTFINMLQENYLNIFSDINSASKASDFLCQSDYILQRTTDSWMSREISLSVTVRGLMDSNKAPIKKFQQFSKSKQGKANELRKYFNDNIKESFCLSNPTTILLDSVTYFNKMSSKLENEFQKSYVKELSCFYSMDKHF